MENNLELDEIGFVFIDGKGRPYWCRMYGGAPMLMYWHESQKSWVVLRQASQAEVFYASLHKIDDNLAKTYHDQHENFINPIS